ncbi:MAG TPA: DUF5916 domain-containing protein [Thermoanaerobaculia bacterium]|nr:DUF5916 domain-containing protein [Thermoanaerobaculia bacterium]
MKKTIRGALGALLLILVSAPLWAQTPPPDSNAVLRVPRLAVQPHLQDIIPGGAAGMTKVTDLRQNTPKDGEPVTLGTSVYLGYDDTNLYVAFVCQDEPDKVRARVTRREDIFGDEGVQIFLDTFHDKQRAYVFAANPYGVQLDGITTEGQGYDFNFDTLWYSEGRITKDGFAVLMTIPFKSIRFAQGPTQRWGVSLSRIIPRKNEFVYWPWITDRVEGFVPQFATLEIDESISPGRNYQFIPYSVLTHSRLLEPGGPGALRPAGYNNTTPGRVGLDGKFVLRDSLAADLTVNPDFSEVESDEPQVIVNQRFEVLFPEKRPFFLENAGFFGTPMSLFFSRRIADPRVGARLTGRVGRWALGGLAIDDREGGLGLPLDHPEFGKRANIGVARMQRDFGRQSNAGFLLTSRDIGGVSNRVAAFDSRIKINENWTATGQLGKSWNRGGFFGDVNGTAGYFDVNRAGRVFNYDGQYRDISRDFVSDLGFIPRTDIRQTEHTASLKRWTEGTKLFSYGPSVTGLATWDHAGELQDWLGSGSFNFNWVGGTSLTLQTDQGYERFAGLDFRKHLETVSARTEWWKWLTASASYSQGTAVNYFPAPGVQPFLGDRRQVVVGLTLSPFSRLRIDETLIYDDLYTRNAVAGADAGSLVFKNPISRTKINMQFNRYLALRLIVDTHAITPDETLVALPRTKHVTGDVLFSYVLNPGTVLYLGYSDNYDNVALLSGPPSQVVSTHSSLNPTARQYFMKVSYLLRF